MITIGQQHDWIVEFLERVRERRCELETATFTSGLHPMTTPVEKGMATPGRLRIHSQWPHDIFGPNGCIASANTPEDACSIVRAVNGYEKMRAVLALSDECVNALTHKRQIDEDGEFVGVSHQAIDEIYKALIEARSSFTGGRE